MNSLLSYQLTAVLLQAFLCQEKTGAIGFAFVVENENI